VSAKRYDLVVIGAGPAGLAGAIAGGILGRRVAIVERAPELGGALVNTGTLPSKTLRETALALAGFRSRELYGVDLRCDGRRASPTSSATSGREADRADRGLGTTAHPRRRARRWLRAVRGAHILEVTRPRGPTRQLEARNVLVATGSRPVRPAEFLDHPRVWDSDRVLELERLPRSLAVIGAGVIGSEYASTFRALGDDVRRRRTRRAAPVLDGEISSRLEAAMVDLGVRFHWKQRVKACAAKGRGPIRLSFVSGRTLSVDAVLVAAGRHACVDGLGIENAGLALDERGHFRVDARFRTAVRHVFAAGDVVGFPALASVGAEQARVAVCAAFGARLKESIEPLYPTGIYTIPEVSTVGATEEPPASAASTTSSAAPRTPTTRAERSSGTARAS
jgi:NAD(P) transhydrogenase